MIAPRKKLWSTPIEAIEKSLELLDLTIDDTIYDIGAGDGRFLMQCLSKTSAKCFGVEIDRDRANTAMAQINSGGLNLYGRCEMIIANALDVDFSAATSFFLYLVPRGLKIILPIIAEACLGKKLKVVTYMSPLPLPGISASSVTKIQTSNHTGAEWPLYFYHFTVTEDLIQSIKNSKLVGSDIGVIINSSENFTTHQPTGNAEKEDSGQNMN